MNATEVFEVESLLALSHVPVQRDADSVIVGLDLETEISRIAINCNLVSDICILVLEAGGQILTCSTPVSEEKDHAYIQ
jgi:hypothetical protein